MCVKKYYTAEIGTEPWIHVGHDLPLMSVPYLKKKKTVYKNDKHDCCKLVCEYKRAF